MRICQKCGAQVSEMAKFCDQCGEELDRPISFNQKQPEKAQPQETKELPNKIEQSEDTSTPEVEELDLTTLDENAKQGRLPESSNEAANITTKDETQKNESQTDSKGSSQDKSKPKDNIIDLKDVLESEEKVEVDSSIKREVLADDEVFSKICPMCGEEMQINKQLLEDTPVLVKCLKCGNETKIW